jgi:YesN/AraC family two-component response regulator
MPEMDGARCAQKIFELDPLARIVIVSGYDEDVSGPEEMDDSVKAAIKGYLTKPIDLAELTTEVNRALR